MTEIAITPTEGIAQSMIPYYTDGSKKATYLGYLAAGFSVMEAVKLSKIHVKTIHRWREGDLNFVDIEAKATGELRKKLSDELLDIEFTRNFRLVMAKDFKILFKDATDEMLTKEEHDYLNLIRKFYTPQQFAIVKQIISGTVGPGTEPFDFTKTVLTIRLEREEKSIGQRTVIEGDS